MELLALASAALSAASSATSSLNGAAELVERIRNGGGTSDQETQAQLVELSRQVLEAMRNQIASESRFQEIARQLRDLDEFTAEASRYTLIETAAGSRIYSLKPEKADGQPHHEICPNCYHQRSISLLQASGAARHCLRCHTSYRMEKAQQTPRRPATRSNWAAY